MNIKEKNQIQLIPRHFGKFNVERGYMNYFCAQSGGRLFFPKFRYCPHCGDILPEWIDEVK